MTDEPRRRPHITLMVVTDGRWKCLEATLESLFQLVLTTGGGDIFDHWLIVDDSTDLKHAEVIDDCYSFDQHIANPGPKWGFAGAIQMGWAALPEETDYVFHLEDDFVFQRPLNLRAMADVLDHHPYLVQMALRRQAWNATEIEAGGVIECHPQEYVSRAHELHYWLEHRLFFTTNPSLYRRELTALGWPSGPQSEGRFTQLALQNSEERFAYWGKREDPPYVEHIGEQRVGEGY